MVGTKGGIVEPAVVVNECTRRCGSLEALVKFAARAYRRPLSAAEQDDLRAFYRTLRQQAGLGHEGALRDALVKEFKADLLGKASPFPEEDREQRKQDYLAFLLGDSVQLV